MAMMIINSPTFKSSLLSLEYQFEMNSKKVHTARWQGSDISKKPEMATRELLNVNIGVSLPDTEDLDYYREDIGPNLPWADDHFEERVSGKPLNPGVQWRNWPWALSADKFRTGSDGTQEPIFNHTYMERYWPKEAGHISETKNFSSPEGSLPRRGIRHEYGDLADLVALLAGEPDTRQAWIPIFFPEDTGIGDGGRKPCSLGYQFIMRDNRLHVYYPLRSCDIVRHFRDDCYLTVRLLLWVLDQCRRLNPKAWRHVTPGAYTMHCTSLHMFENDWIEFIKRRNG